METINLTAKTRIVPTPAKNQGRLEGSLPAVVYGMGQKSDHLFLSQKEFEKIYARAGESSLIDLIMDQAEPIKVLVKEVQKDPVTEKIIHVDFYRIDMSKELQTTVPLVFVGQSQAVKDFNAILVKSLEEVEIACRPSDLISKIEVDISALKSFEEVIRVRDLQVPETIKILTDPDRSVASAVLVKVQVEEAPKVEVAVEGQEAEKKEGEAGEGEAKEEKASEPGKKDKKE